MLWVRRVSNKRAQLILQLNKSTLPRLRKQKVVWIKKFINELGLFLTLLIQLPCTVITMDPFHKQRNQGIIDDPNKYLKNSIWFDKSMK